MEKKRRGKDSVGQRVRKKEKGGEKSQGEKIFLKWKQ